MLCIGKRWIYYHAILDPETARDIERSQMGPLYRDQKAFVEKLVYSKQSRDYSRQNKKGKDDMNISGVGAAAKETEAKEGVKEKEEENNDLDAMGKGAGKG